MYFDFTLILTLLVLGTLVLWLIARFILRPQMRRMAAEGVDKPPVVMRTVEYIGSFFPVLLLVWLLRSFLFEPFRIPSGSMIPTLLVGDYIVVNKFAYGVRLPVLNYRFMETGLPQRGDVVVFRYPENEKLNYIKRLIGLPGDRITYRNKQLFVNGVRMPLEPIGEYSQPGNRAPHLVRQDMYMENLDGVEHDILLRSRGQAAREESWEVPEGHYFMMGDNRDNSQDSRAWGMVPEANLVGRAERIWWHWDCSHGCLDIGRLGTKID